MTTQAMTVIDRGAGLAVQEMQSRMATIVAVMANVLEEGKDYGKIPGTDKPTLYKPGAEKLMLTFALAPARPTVEDLSTGDEIRYRVAVPIEASDGRVLAVGIGEASTNEEKYRWKKPVCDEEWDETPEVMRRVKWARGNNGKAYQVAQIRTSPADLANTVLKMAHKRAFVAGTLLATGASSVFNQDAEDFAKELHENVTDAEERPQVRRASEVKRASAPAAGVTGQVTEPRRVKDLRTFGKDKNNYAVVLEGDTNEYTTKDAALAGELGKFKGTDHKLRITFEDNDWNGKTYHNIKSFVVADDEAQAPPVKPSAPAAPTPNPPTPQTSTPPPPATTTPLTAGDIPFGGRS